MRRLPLLLALLAVGLVAVAGFLYLTDRPLAPQPPFTVEPTEFDLELIPPGYHDLIVRITNPANVPRRIIGLAEGCGLNCCYFTKHGEIVTVGAGETFEYHVGLLVKGPGPFESGIAIFLEDRGIREVQISVKGVGVEAGDEK